MPLWTVTLIRQPDITLNRIVSENGCDLLAVSVMPGPQMRAAISLCRAFRSRYPCGAHCLGRLLRVALHRAALNAPYVDFVVRGQGEETFLELLEVVRGRRNTKDVRGLSFKDAFGLHVHNAERPLRSPNDFPVAALPPIAQRRALHSPDVSWQTNGRTPGEHRVSISLHILRRRPHLPGTAANRRRRAHRFRPTAL